MGTIEIFSKKVSVGRNISSPIESEISLYEVFRHLIPEYEDELKNITSLEYGSKEYKEAKLNIPWFTPSGTGVIGENPVDSNMASNNLLAVDIDAADNPGVDLISKRKELLAIPGVVGVYKSVSGKGVWVLFLIRDASKAKLYYKYIADTMKLKGITVDAKCDNISRKRIIGYNPDWKEYTNWDDIRPWDLYRVESYAVQKEPIRATRLFTSVHNDIDRLREAISKCADGGWYEDDYRRWYYVACDCKNLPDGYQLFEKISNNNPSKKDSQKILMKTYDNAKPTGVTECIGKWINRSKSYK